MHRMVVFWFVKNVLCLSIIYNAFLCLKALSFYSLVLYMVYVFFIICNEKHSLN